MQSSARPAYLPGLRPGVNPEPPLTLELIAACLGIEPEATSPKHQLAEQAQ